MTSVQFDRLGLTEGLQCILLRLVTPVEDSEEDLLSFPSEHQIEAVALVLAMLPEIQWHGLIHRRILKDLFDQCLPFWPERHQVITA